MWDESRVPKAASGHISQTSKSEIPKDTSLSKDRERSPAVLGPQRIPSDMKTNKARDYITQNSTDPSESQWNRAAHSRLSGIASPRDAQNPSFCQHL